MKYPPAKRHPGQALCFWGGVLLILLAPLVRGGNRYVALIGLEWIGLATLFGALIAGIFGEARSWGQGPVRFALWMLVLSPLWVAIFQLTPVPSDWWAQLPGRSFYLDLLGATHMPAVAWRPASLTPEATAGSLLAGIPIVACVVLGLTSSVPQLRLLIRLWVGAAFAQALLGLAQLGPFPGLYFGAFFTGVIGTFANSNHLASFLVMAMPFVILELHQAWNKPNRSTNMGNAGWLWGPVLLVLLIAILATRSRAGVAISVIVLVGTVVLLPGKKENRTEVAWRLGGVAAILGASLIAAGLDWGSNLGEAAIGKASSDRYLMLISTWEAAKEFWPAGSGLGSFASIYPRFQPVALKGFVEFAHSDYAQLLMECGLIFVVLATAALALLLIQGHLLATKRLSTRALRTEELAMLTAGMSLSGILLHAWVDFNFRIPALAMFGAFSMGVYLRRRDVLSRDRMI
jgi:hypothetical protein